MSLSADGNNKKKKIQKQKGKQIDQNLESSRTQQFPILPKWSSHRVRVINVAFKCVFHRTGRGGGGKRLEIGDGDNWARRRKNQAKSCVRLNYVRLLRVLADFVIRFSLELDHSCWPVQSILFCAFLPDTNRHSIAEVHNSQANLLQVT